MVISWYACQGVGTLTIFKEQIQKQIIKNRETMAISWYACQGIYYCLSNLFWTLSKHNCISHKGKEQTYKPV